MIEDMKGLRAELRKKNMTMREFEVRLSVLSGKSWSIYSSKRYEESQGSFSSTQKALFNSIFFLNFEEFRRIGALHVGNTNRGSDNG